MKSQFAVWCLAVVSCFTVALAVANTVPSSELSLQSKSDAAVQLAAARPHPIKPGNPNPI